MVDDSHLVEADERARSDALDTARSFIVQAPAGSGKTELLIQRYLALLAIVDEPEEVRAMTFTVKAALEMQSRILLALRSADDTTVPSTAHEAKTRSLATAALRRSDERAWRLPESPSRIRIGTVDAFGAAIARQLPLSSRMGGGLVTVSDAEMQSLYREAAVATLDYLTTTDTAGQAVARLLKHLDVNTGQYVRYLSSMLASREQWLEITGGGIGVGRDTTAIRAELEDNIAHIIGERLRLLVASMPKQLRENLPPLLRFAANSLRENDRGEHALSQFGDCRKLPGTSATDVGAWQAISRLFLKTDGNWRRQLTIAQGFPKEQKSRKAEMLELIESLHDDSEFQARLYEATMLPPARYSDDQWQVLLSLIELLPLAAAELKHLFAGRGFVDHTEVAMAARRALGDVDEPGEAALLIDYQLRHLLIDEMQDTSISQYQLIEKVTAGWQPGDGRTIFCVGDPMQSIYRFRDAEVGEFILARNRGIGGLPLNMLTLRRNFRSGEFLVNWFNTVFGQVMPGDDDVASGAVAYSESVPVEARAEFGDIQLHPLVDATKVDEATRTFSIVQQCLENTKDDDIAILVRSRSHLSALLPMLRQAAISYEAVEIDRLTDLPEIIDLLALTRALAHEGDRLAWLALLRGPWVGLSWADLHALVKNDAAKTIGELVSDESRLDELSNEGQQRVRHLVAQIAPYRESHPVRGFREQVELAWCALGGPALLGDLDEMSSVSQFFAVLDRLSTSGTLQDVRELEPRLDEERVSGGNSEKSRVKVMTIYKAKGLQFDHVILPALGRPPRLGQREVLDWLNVPNAEAGNVLLVSPVGPRSERGRDPLHDFISATGREKSRAELDRLLYVACTRAKKSLHLIGSVPINKAGDSLTNPRRDTLLGRLWPVVKHQFEDAFVADDIDDRGEEDNDDTEWAVPLLRRIKAPFEPPRPNPLPRTIRDNSSGVGDELVSFDWVGSSLRHAGTIVHRWLQRLADGRISRQSINDKRLRQISERWAGELGVPENQIDSVCVRVAQAVANTLSDERGQWLLSGEGSCELPITGLVDGSVESIVIDRIRIDEHGTHWVVDYKTSSHEGAGLETFLEQETDRYRSQLTKYAQLYRNLSHAPVRTALYFPLLGEFVEVETA